jgi:hypothetical protein
LKSEGSAIPSDEGIVVQNNMASQLGKSSRLAMGPLKKVSPTIALENDKSIEKQCGRQRRHADINF